ncbi:putative XPB associated nuclease Bax1 [Candidatus Nitrosocaldus cavascurensis]|jgi:hypothetical protein|uniref:Putative XPB associated nuclease Bax1 n=2 Tax=Candidatus Nitrosocaldaceae TaxID=1968910 RepID=A0A2K5AR34_9ARCH|nr:putative XPB associated nuclease Bax1 [Candidatus Nitrosocaldus cavascurensis]
MVMLPTSLVRARARKGRIVPVFASQDDEGLASLIIDEFMKAYSSRERKGILIDRIRELEYGSDYRLVRGFYTILERRCVFKRIDTPVHPILLRREVFKESSRRGYALTDGERRSIMDEVASRLKIDRALVEEMMWSDLEENLIMQEFRPISPEELVGEYNLALIQGMLLNCTRMECSVSQGIEWKVLLRDVKRLGLMYMLDEHRSMVDKHKHEHHPPSSIVCMIDGPASIFKLTDRYGVAMARLLPTLLKAGEWWFRAWIVRKGMGVGSRRVYELEFSSKDAREMGIALMPSRIEGYTDEEKELPSTSKVYDSSIEERFATLFNQYGTGWRLVREPEPIVVSGQAFIPDFVLEKYGKKIYVEIVGFWTKDYIERKVQKLIQMNKSRGMDKDGEMILLVNKELVCSEPIHMEHLSRFARLVMYDGKKIPMKQIIAHLKSIEDEITAEHVSDDALMNDVKEYIKGLNHGRIISIKKVAERFNITYDAVLSIITSIVESGELPNHEMVMNEFLIARDVLEGIKRDVGIHERLVDACKVMEGYGVPEEYYTSLLSILGYTIVWRDIDINNAVIVKVYDDKDKDKDDSSL